MIHSAAEQLFLELTNRARLDPLGEAARQGVAINEGLEPGQLSGAQLQPLAGNANLQTAADAHNNWMVDSGLVTRGQLSHTGENGTSARQRMEAAGYDLYASWSVAENLAFWGHTEFDSSTAVIKQMDGLWASPGHRLNTMNPVLREIGIDVTEFTMPVQGTTIPASVSTHNFASVSERLFITGVVMEDLDGDKFYDMTEGRGGFTFASGANTTESAETGGYALQVGKGFHTLSLQGGEAQVRLQMADQNVKLDAHVGEDGELVRLLSSGSVAVTSQSDLELGVLGVTGLSLGGGAGNDTLLGGVGGDTLYGGAGHDLLNGGAGDDFLYGGEGNDTIYTGAGVDEVWAGNGDDVLYGEQGRQLLAGGAGNDTFYGGAGQSTIWAGAGNDVVYAGSGTVEIWMGTGDSSLYGGSASGVLGGGAGNDIIEAGTAGAQMKYIWAGAGNDSVTGSEAADQIGGGLGHDTIRAGGGQDTVWGAAGDDFVYGGAGNDLLYGGDGVDVIYGDEGNDRIYLGAGNDTAYGGAGNDTLNGAGGNDVFYGGAGADTFEFWRGQGSTEIADFSASEGDRLALSQWMWRGASGELTAAQLVERFASINDDGHVEMSFPTGGNTTLVLVGHSSLDQLASYIDII